MIVDKTKSSHSYFFVCENLEKSSSEIMSNERMEYISLITMKMA